MTFNVSRDSRDPKGIRLTESDPASAHGKCPDCGGPLQLHGRTMRWCEACRQIIGIWDAEVTR